MVLVRLLLRLSGDGLGFSARPSPPCPPPTPWVPGPSSRERGKLAGNHVWNRGSGHPESVSGGPTARAGDGVLPLIVATLTFGSADGRFEDAIDVPELAQVLEARTQPTAERRQKRRTNGGGFDICGADDRDTQ